MHAMAQAQARSPRSPGRPPEDSFPFSTLRVWRDKLHSDISAPGMGDPGWKLRLLLQQGKDVEQAVQGCLKDALFDLHEGVAFGLLSPEFEERQRALLLNAAANELHTDKQLCLQLAREHGLLEAYAQRVKRSSYHTISEYERVGELRFGMLVWRANLRRDSSLADDPQEMEAQFQSAYTDALRLIRRCGTKSLQYWSVQQAGGAPPRESKQALYQVAVQRVHNSLLELGEARGVDQAYLTRLFQQVSDPDEVEEEPADEEEEEEEAEAGGGVSREASREGFVHGGRGSSEESETEALGLRAKCSENGS